MGKGRQANNQRSNSMNPNNPAHRASVVNRGNQLNPKHSVHESSRAVRSGGGGGWGWGESTPPAPPTVDEQIAKARQAVDEGRWSGNISGVEASLRGRDTDGLRALVQEIAKAGPSLGAGWAEAAADQDQTELRDRIWMMIKKEFTNENRRSMEEFLRSIWIPRHLPDGLPDPPRDLEEEARRRYYDDDDDD